VQQRLAQATGFGEDVSEPGAVATGSSDTLRNLGRWV
jgi:hypothetical protein